MGSDNLLSTKQLICEKLMPKALAERWTTARLAKEAGVSSPTARAVMERHARRVSDINIKAESELVKVARESQKRALSRLPRLEKLLEQAEMALKGVIPQDLGGKGNPVALDEFGQPIPANPGEIIKAVSGLVKTAKDLHSHMEQITGLDVVKAVSVRSQTNKDGPLVSWDGVEALAWSVDQDKMPALPAPSEPDDTDFC